MKKRFERSLSLILVILTILVFAITALNLRANLQIQALNHIWNLSFILSWILMLAFSIYILFQKDSKGFSIFVAIITSVAFILLSYHAIIATSNYLSFMPKQVNVNNRLIVLNGQMIFYTSLIAVYIIHLINLLMISRRDFEDKTKIESLDIEEKNTEDIIIVNNQD